ncbi:MAG: hypothetical protein ACYDG5_02330 [Dehalococcoidales bacterium]
MVEIRFGDQYEVSDLAGLTVSEAREQFKSEFGIPDKAKVRLNGSKVKTSAEIHTVLNDDDQITFAVARSRVPFLIGALLLALAATGGIFAFGFLNANVTLSASTYSDFASVTANTDNLGFDVWGLYKGTIFSSANQDLFYITPNGGWNGDLVTTVTLGNVGDLAKTYRAFGLQLGMYYKNGPSGGLPIQIISGSSDNTTVLLSLDYPSVNIFTPSGNWTLIVKIKSGFYVAQLWPFGGSGSPQIFCDVTQGTGGP